MEVHLGFCLLLACVDAGNATLHFPNLPAYEVCRAAAIEAEWERHQLRRSAELLRHFCSHRAYVFHELYLEATARAEVWQLATALKVWPVLDPVTLERQEARLIFFIGEDRFYRGELSWPLSWRRP
jgi:hypothetical protein